MATLSLDQLQWITLLVWLCVLGLFLGLAAMHWLSGREIRLHARVAWVRLTPGRGLTARPWLLGVASTVSAAFVVQASAGETMSVRIAGALIAAAAVWLLGDWGWRQAALWMLRRSAQARDWSLRAHACTSEIQALFDPPSIREAACRLLRTGLGCSHVYYFGLEEGRYGYQSGFPAPAKELASISADSTLARVLAAGVGFRALIVDRPGQTRPPEWARSGGETAAAELIALRSLEARVVVPLQQNTSLAGFFLLGPARLEHGYQSCHLDFAEEVARQSSASLAAAAHVLPLLERASEIAGEQASRRAARTNRAHLAPPDPVDVTDLDYAARTWTGDLPGGVFHDAIALPGRAAAFFVAEIPGPPEAASVRLVQLQALLRTRARAYHEDLAELLRSTRRAIALSAANHEPVSLFCARYLTGSGRLQYVNAGLYPPILLRRSAAGGETIRLTRGGEPLAAGAETPYEVGELEVRHGDLLAVASSGVAESANAAGEGWGETRLVDALAGLESQRSSEVVELALRAADEFAGRDPSQAPRVLLVLQRRAEPLARD